MAILTTSSPGNRAVAPYGGREARYSTNPIAFGIPTDDGPILIDTSTSSTTNRNLERTQRMGGKLAQPVRVAVTGGAVSPGIFETLAVLGRDRSLARIADAVQLAGHG